MIAQLSEGFLLGIATGTTCLATCGPLYAPYLMLSGRGIGASLLTLLEISGGRFLTYLLVGLVAGLMSRSLNELGDRSWFTAIAYIAFSLYLLFSVFIARRKTQCCPTSKWAAIASRPFVLGLLTGINFCPSFLLAFTKAITLSGPLAGMALFAAFFAGTSLFLLPLSFFGAFGQKLLIKRVAQVCAVGVSAWFIAQGAWTLYGLVSQKPAVLADEKNIINVMDSLPCYIIADDTLRQKSFRKVLSTSRKGSVAILSTTAVMPEQGYFFAFETVGDTLHPHQNPLRRAGRFLLLLPSGLRDSLDEKKSRRIADFLTKYSFKLDPDSGSVFRIPDNVIN